MKTPREILIAISELPIHEAIKMLRDDMGLEATQVLHALTRASLTPRGKCYRVALRPFVSVAGARKIQAIKIIREEFSFNLKVPRLFVMVNKRLFSMEVWKMSRL